MNDKREDPEDCVPRRGRTIAVPYNVASDYMKEVAQLTMPSKRIIVLANSIKKQARCVAGVEDVGTGRTLARAGWIRPVSGESEGELEPRHMRISDDKPLRVLDIVEISFTKHANDQIHPEDWIVDADKRWTRSGSLKATSLAKLEEKPKNLWLEPNLHSDRATNTFLLKQPNHQSLYLIRPDNFRVELSVKQYNGMTNPSLRRRAHFSYRGQDYEMNLTDPVFIDAYCGRPPSVGEGPRTVQLPGGKMCLICVSLTPLFRDYHWKVVATVLELP